MNNGAHVGSSVVIKGELSAREDIRIAGRVEGRVDVDGYTVTLEESGEMHADVSAAGIAVAGAVKGSLVAERRIELRPTATVEGDIAAPTIRVEDGALVNGKMDIEGFRGRRRSRRRRRRLSGFEVRGSRFEPRTPNPERQVTADRYLRDT